MRQIALLGLAFLLGSCLPNMKIVQGTIVEVQHDPTYEEPCGIRGALFHMCDDPPVCCSYWATLRDSTHHETTFFAQWPKSAPGLWAGEEIWAKLRKARVHGACTMYGCYNETIALALWGDTDYVIVRP